MEETIRRNPENKEELEESIKQLQVEKQLANIDLNDLYLSQKVLDEQIKDLYVQSNFDSKILSVNLEKENLEQPLLHLGSDERFIVTGSISEFESLQVKIGQKVEISSELSEEFSWQGEVVSIGDLPVQSEGEGANRYPITVKINESDINIKPGFNLLLEIETNNELVKSLPNSAIVQEGAQTFVYTIENNKALKKEVSTGIAEGSRIEIKSGISKKDTIILNPSSSIKDGSVVIIND